MAACGLTARSSLVLGGFKSVPIQICRRCISSTIGLSLNKTHLYYNPYSSSVLKSAYRHLGRSNRRSFVRKDNENGQPSFSLLWKPAQFTVAMSTSSFVGAMIWQYESVRSQAKAIIDAWGLFDKNNSFYPKQYRVRSQINEWWQNMSTNEKCALGIVGVNCLVFLLWRIPNFHSFMLKYFCSNPTSVAPCWSMLFSAFSHFNFIHLATNMYVLWSFSGVALELFGREQFVGFYLSAATVSSLASYFLKITKGSFTPTVGASGALMAVLGAVCLSYPETRLSVAFIGDIIPFSFSAQNAMQTLISFDVIGVLLGWKLFDHAGHLGGMIFGLWYVSYGKKMIWDNREKIIKYWHEIRGKTR